MGRKTNQHEQKKNKSMGKKKNIPVGRKTIHCVEKTFNGLKKHTN